ncbi:sensor histidine kinase [Acinetobacter sp. MB5]|uniref:sensor histidine kinase n=1 Tax=Acinetobacter sp. MB5 TaxID=2069438 RepID=UPI000DD0DF59|nr:ATP-binding protein [Acinetobacter sp. MB5]
MNALSTSNPNTLYRLGMWYGVYRLIISFSLMLIFFLTFHLSTSSYEHIGIYFFTLLIYSFLGTLQLLALKLFPVALSRQLLLISLIDVGCYSSLTFALGGPNLHIGLLFVITIFIANLLLSRSQALGIVLISIIAVFYLQLFGSWFATSNLSRIGNSVLLAFLFFVVYLTGQFAVQRFRLLEHISITQSLELLQLQNINRYILEQIDMGYLAIDENKQVVLSNPAAYTLLGIPTLMVFRPAPLQDIQPDLYQYLEQNSANQGERFIFETMQSRYSIHIRVQKLELPQQTLTLFVMQDAQKINQHVQQLKLAALGQLSASIAHEIRNPLSSIVQANCLLSDANTEQQQLLTAMIQKQTQRINHIIQSTLNMAHNQATLPIDIQLKHFLPQLIIEDLYEVHSQILLEIRDDVFISFDEGQLRQVLTNLIRNALRHNAPDQPQIHVYAYQQDDYAFMDVIDFGTGIATNRVHNLFSPFFTTEIDGTGLGLYLSRSFCEANQAKLSYIKLQDGTCFRIECPAIQIE